MKLQFALKQAAVATAFALAGLAAQAQTTVGFTCTSNDSGVCPAVASQITLTITDLGGGLATFRLDNTGSLDSSITDVYWQNTSLTGGGSITDSGAGVSFSWGASPPNPGGGIAWDASISADSNNPTQPNGGNPGAGVSFAVGYSGTVEAKSG